MFKTETILQQIIVNSFKYFFTVFKSYSLSSEFSF